MHREYDEKLMGYIIDYVKANKIPPTFDLMIKNVSDVKSRSTLYAHLQKLVQKGQLTQKGTKGYYYPCCLDTKAYWITDGQIEELIRLSCDNTNGSTMRSILSGIREGKEER